MFGFIGDLFKLIYPSLCTVCHGDLAKDEVAICLKCIYRIPRTRYWLEQENPVAKVFWGRANVENACSLFFFSKGSSYRKLLHLLKYNGRKDIGITLGKELGYELSKSEFYRGISLIIPVPLHPKRLKQRGYNQAEAIAQGLSESLNLPMVSDNLQRVEYTQSQTKKNRDERVKNVSNAFRVYRPDELADQHLLLVDDVITTGATLEESANVLLQVPGAKVSIVTLAYTSF